jgi:hypothetical protein
VRGTLASLVIAWAALVPATALARPKADLVIAWAPGVNLAPVEAAARDAGAAVIDRSPRPGPRLETVALIKRGMAAFDALQLEDAARLLADAKAEIDRTGAAELTETELSDLFLYRGLLAIQRENPTAAWDELVAALTVAPTRVLDPARFAPKVAVELDRVRKTLETRPRPMLRVDVPDGCKARVDGAVTSGPQAHLLGTHWISVSCTAHQPWGTRVELGADTTVVARNTPIAPPTGDEMLIQARTAGARAFVAIEVAGGFAVVRLVAADGRELDRRTVSVRSGNVVPLTESVRTMLAPEDKQRWYQSKWVWAAGAALLAAAVLVPVTAAVASDKTQSTFVTKVGNPW